MDGFDPARIAMLTAGSGLLVGSVTSAGDPHAVRAWSAEVIGLDPLRIRVGVAVDDSITVPSLHGRAVALTAADIRTIESIQVKGFAEAMGPPGPYDTERIRSQSEAFLRTIEETDGDPVEFLRRLIPNTIEMVEIVVTEIYDQTPGPHAGVPIGATT